MSRANVKFPNDRKEYFDYLEKAGDKLVVVVFTTKRNSSCSEMFEKLEFLAKTKLRQYKLEYVNVDLDVCKDLNDYGIVKAVPCFLIIHKKYKEEDQDWWEGTDAIDCLEEKVKSNMEYVKTK